MSNEILLIGSVLLIYTTVYLLYRFLNKTGCYMWTVIATIAANIEVLILVNAFGIEQTLGNILFASTFLVTDILSEVEGKKAANKAVLVGVLTNIIFVCISQSWLLYTPSENDFIFASLSAVFSNTTRVIIASVSVYAIAQMFDVWVYHRIWNYTEKLFKDNKKGLWLRNNGSTLISQFINSILFTFFAFYGMYDLQTVISIVFSSYIIYVITSLLDTPFVYLARNIKK